MLLIEPIKILLKPYDLDTDECIVWNGTLNGAGYPYLHTYKRSILVTRLVLLLDGRLVSLDDERLACHTCNNPRCINKRHLYAGNKSSNSFDTVKAGTHYVANRTKCGRGHEYTPENTRLYRGVRYCKSCHSLYMRRHRSKANAR